MFDLQCLLNVLQDGPEILNISVRCWLEHLKWLAFQLKVAHDSRQYF